MDLFSNTNNKKLQLSKPLAFFDLETTGTDIATDRIVEIAIIKMMPDESIIEYRQLINPGCPIPKGASDIHHITDDMVANEPRFEQVANTIAQFIGNADFAGFNSNRFDIPLLVEEMLKAGIDIEIEKRKCVDVQRIFHKNEPRNLEAAYNFYCNKKIENAHSALADVKATYEVLLAQVEKYDNLKTDVNNLAEFSDDAEVIDVARRFIKRDGKIYFNFGKHKNFAVTDVLRKEPQYYDWVMKNDFPLHTKLKLKQIKEGILK